MRTQFASSTANFFNSSKLGIVSNPLPGKYARIEFPRGVFRAANLLRNLLASTAPRTNYLLRSFFPHSIQFSSFDNFFSTAPYPERTSGSKPIAFSSEISSSDKTRLGSSPEYVTSQIRLEIGSRRTKLGIGHCDRSQFGDCPITFHSPLINPRSPICKIRIASAAV